MISVIIPVYNVEPYLEKCIRSVLNNTYRDLEILCINDGSTDSSLSVLRQLAAEDRRIIIINQENKGVQAARNTGLEKASGEYIAFIDSDDEIHPMYFQSLLKCMEEHNADITVCECMRIGENDEPEIRQYDEIEFHQMSDAQFFKNYYARHMCWERLYRRSRIGDIRFSPEVMAAEDTLFNLRTVSGIEDPVVYITSAPMYYYRQRKDSLVTKTMSRGFIDLPVWVAEHDVENDKNKWSWMLLMQAVKFSLSCRYEAWIEKNTEKIHYANQILAVLTGRMMKSRLISVKEKVIHMIMKQSPQFYRYCRIKNDPTMKTWKKTVRDGN